jgi:hypothetical protein
MSGSRCWAEIHSRLRAGLVRTGGERRTKPNMSSRSGVPIELPSPSAARGRPDTVPDRARGLRARGADHRPRCAAGRARNGGLAGVGRGPARAGRRRARDHVRADRARRHGRLSPAVPASKLQDRPRAARAAGRAGFGWIFRGKDRATPARYAKDLRADRDLRSISRMFPLWALAGRALPIGADCLRRGLAQQPPRVPQLRPSRPRPLAARPPGTQRDDRSAKAQEGAARRWSPAPPGPRSLPLPAGEAIGRRAAAIKPA